MLAENLAIEIAHRIKQNTASWKAFILHEAERLLPHPSEGIHELVDHATYTYRIDKNCRIPLALFQKNKNKIGRELVGRKRVFLAKFAYCLEQ